MSSTGESWLDILDGQRPDHEPLLLDNLLPIGSRCKTC
ncbi:hypothetical protein MES5069_190102 [Mesorhizobium escarrei]|uniref:Uncharacterized protein n=1 Tax=Mesorhizobium escarrei TaxID=666018 RepID=A0ABN8JIZ4_9HYPH|nr:hypothetical protein MES5069_190102 [Mesorhizobium escarrei]